MEISHFKQNYVGFTTIFYRLSAPLPANAGRQSIAGYCFASFCFLTLLCVQNRFMPQSFTLNKPNSTFKTLTVMNHDLLCLRYAVGMKEKENVGTLNNLVRCHRGF